MSAKKSIICRSHCCDSHVSRQQEHFSGPVSMSMDLSVPVSRIGALPYRSHSVTRVFDGASVQMVRRAQPDKADRRRAAIHAGHVLCRYWGRFGSSIMGSQMGNPYVGFGFGGTDPDLTVKRYSRSIARYRSQMSDVES